MLQIDSVVNSIFDSMTWLLSDMESNQVWLVDCGDIEPVVEKLQGRAVAGVLLTHAHFDHIYGLPKLIELFPECKIYTNRVGVEALGSAKKNLSKYHECPIEIVTENIVCVKEGDVVSLFNDSSARVYEMPGHSPSCLVFEVGDFLFAGDAYIPGIPVVTNLPGGDKAMAKESRERIIAMLAGHQLCPGHATNKSII